MTALPRHARGSQQSSRLAARLSPLLSPLLLGGAAALLSLLNPAPGRANMVQQIIVGKCSSAMQADFKKAGKTPPTGMVDFTCGCVSDGMLKRRQSLEQAKSTCVQQATQKYGAI
jgi:hypothetical protein